MGRAQDAERRGQMAVQDGVPLLVGHFLDDVVPGVAGIVHDDVEALVGLHRGCDEPVREIGGGDVADAGDSLAAQGLDLGDGLQGRRLVQVVDHDAGAFGGELQRNGPANAASGSGDQRDLAVKFGGHEMTFCKRGSLNGTH